MGDLISFRKARQSIARELDRQRAASNRLLHGRSKADQNRDAARNAKARRALDQHRVETGDER
jgi:hypothetical protein